MWNLGSPRRGLQIIGLTVAVLIPAACTSDGSTGTQPTQAQPTVEERVLTPEQPAPTPTAARPSPEVTPEPSATPTGPTPVPEPVFTRVVLPEEAVTRSETAMFGVARPTDEFDWLGVGRHVNRQTGVISPRAWQLSNDVLVQTELPVPDDLGGASASDAGHLAGTQIVSGNAFSATDRRAVIWTRPSPESEWSLAPLPDLDHPDNAKSGVALLLAAEDVGLLIIDSWQPTVVDDNGELIFTQHLFHNNDATAWSPLELPDFDPSEVAIERVRYHQDQLFVLSAPLQAVAQRIWISADQGDSWQSTETAPNAHIELVNWFNDHPIGFGAMSQSSSATGSKFTPLFFTFDKTTGWNSAEATFDGIEFNDSTVVELNDLDVIDSGLRLGITADNVRYQALSSDGLRWTIDPTADLSDLPAAAHNDIATSIDTDGRRLVALGAEPPAWAQAGALTNADLSHEWNAGIQRWHKDLLGQARTFQLLVGEHENLYTTDLWTSEDGVEWSLEQTDDDFLAIASVPAKSGIISYGYEPGGPYRVERFGDDEYVFAVQFWELNGQWTRDEHMASTSGGSLIALSHSDERDGPGTPGIIMSSRTTGPSDFASLHWLAGYEPVSVCDHLDGENPVLLWDQERRQSHIIPWSHAATRSLLFEDGLPIEGSTWASVELHDCATLSEQFMVTGRSCPDGSTQPDPAKCSAMVLQSTDGEEWTMHPSTLALEALGISSFGEIAAVEGGAIAVSPSLDGSNNTLWFLTDSQIFRLPTGGLHSPFGIDIEQMATIDTHLMLRSRTSIFVAPVDELLAQAEPIDS